MSRFDPEKYQQRKTNIAALRAKSAPTTLNEIIEHVILIEKVLGLDPSALSARKNKNK